MPEGDALHLAAQRLQPLVGQRIAAESPNPRAQALRVADRIDGRVLESIEAVGKNLLFRFEGGVPAALASADVRTLGAAAPR